MHDFDYTNRTASALSHGHLGLERRPDPWLNEMFLSRANIIRAFPLAQFFVLFYVR
jgi:hypothetical protein